MSKDKSKYCRYLKSAEDSLKKALLVDNYTNRSFTITTKISKSAKYPVRNPIKIMNGANYESDASDAMDISPPESSEEELSSNEADLVWLDPEILKKADCLETAEIPELFQLSAKKDLAELGKTKFGKLVLKLGKKGYFSNFGEAKEILTSVWDELTQEEINNMIKGLKGRAEDVVESQGRFREGQKLNRGAFTKN